MLILLKILCWYLSAFIPAMIFHKIVYKKVTIEDIVGISKVSLFGPILYIFIIIGYSFDKINQFFDKIDNWFTNNKNKQIF
jgi:hypothetical protein